MADSSKPYPALSQYRVPPVPPVSAMMAIRTGAEKDRVLVVEDGVVVDLVDGLATVTG